MEFVDLQCLGVKECTGEVPQGVPLSDTRTFIQGQDVYIAYIVVEPQPLGTIPPKKVPNH